MAESLFSDFQVRALKEGECRLRRAVGDSLRRVSASVAGGVSKSLAGRMPFPPGRADKQEPGRM